MFDDTAAWRAHASYAGDEQAWRLHHRLTAIHPFPNGNGRCARLMADHYLQQQGHAPFSWGITMAAGEVRSEYIAAIRAADRGDYLPLSRFVRR